MGRAFGRRASAYAGNASLQIALLRRLVPAIVRLFRVSGGPWADLGCGVGVLSDLIKEHGVRQPAIVETDLSFEVLTFIRAHKNNDRMTVQADIARPPFKPEALKGVVAASVFQWCENPGRAIIKTLEVLGNHGYCVFSIFVDGSFKELFTLRSAFGMDVPVMCPDPEKVQELFSRAHCTLLEQTIFSTTMFFPDALTLLKNLSDLGGTATAGKKLNRSELGDFCRMYESRYRTSAGVPLSYKTLIGVCRKEIQP